MGNKTQITTWNNRVSINAETFNYPNLQFENIESLIAYGNGRSYGDAPLNEKIVLTESLTGILSFDTENGILICKSGTLLSEIITSVLPYGWFLEITPGTKSISVGGAIAAEIHGKNHFCAGGFSSSVLEFELDQGIGEIKACSRENNSTHFWFTFGGMGLTGIITTVKLKLQKIQSPFINVENHKINSFQELLQCFEKSSLAEHKIAWIRNSKTNHFQSIYTEGREAVNVEFKDIKSNQSLIRKIPFQLKLLNPVSKWAYEFLRYSRTPEKSQNSILDFHYPLDKIENWNVAYGKNGFLQYQFCVPSENAAVNQEIFKITNRQNLHPFVSVIKKLGKSNAFSPLAFPIEGFTLAMDFQINENLLKQLNVFDQLVVEAKGRVYLAKDFRLNSGNFRKMYPDWETFSNWIRIESKGKFQSLLSRRLKIT